jgi:hypothetical protein
VRDKKGLNGIPAALFSEKIHLKFPIIISHSSSESAALTTSQHPIAAHGHASNRPSPKTEGEK